MYAFCRFKNKNEINPVKLGNDLIVLCSWFSSKFQSIDIIINGLWEREVLPLGTNRELDLDPEGKQNEVEHLYNLEIRVLNFGQASNVILGQVM